MIRHLLRPIHGISLLICLVLAACSGEPEKPATNAAPATATATVTTPESSAKVRQRLAGLNQRIARINDRIRELNEEQVRQLDALTSETEALQAEIAALGGQFGGKAPVAATRTASPAGKTAAPATSDSDSDKRNPLGIWSRTLLVIIILFAIWIFVRIFLGRWAEEEEDDEELGGDVADEEPGAEDAPLHRLDPDVRAPGERPGETPRGGAADERDEPKA